MQTFVEPFGFEAFGWMLGAFFIAFIPNSFIEWFAHKFVLHGTTFGRFAYELHHVQHHGMFGADATYHALNAWMKKHVAFVARDYFLFLLITTPIWIGVELLIQKPILIGCILATLTNLQMFNSFHWRFHVPSDTWFQRTWFFRFLKNHHRIHHADHKINLNVYFFPIADLCLGTLRRSQAN